MSPLYLEADERQEGEPWVPPMNNKKTLMQIRVFLLKKAALVRVPLFRSVNSCKVFAYPAVGAASTVVIKYTPPCGGDGFVLR